MRRNLTPILRQEMANLDKDSNRRKSAMKALKSYVKDLDSKTIPLFLAQVSETKQTGSLSGEFTISLYEVLARVHGIKIVPMIDSIMASIIQTLASSAGSFPLHQACSKVVPAIARYGIEPTTPEEKKRHIIHSLCKPLSDSLLGSLESLTSGAALCLKALVDSDNWRYASDEMVNMVCQNVSGALEEKSTQTNSHMGLVMALAKRNALIVEAYARLLILSGLGIVNAGQEEGNSQKRFSAIQMVNFLMKWLDPRSIYSELDMIMEEMEKCQSDKMAFVKGAAFEALQTAKKIDVEKGSRYEKGPGSVTGSNFSRRGHGGRRNLSWDADRCSPASVSPESQSLELFSGYESWTESPIFIGHVTHSTSYDRRSVNRKLWSNGGVDVSLKDGLFSEVAPGNDDSCGNDEFSNNRRDATEEFTGFLHKIHRHGVSRSTTTSPQRSRIDNIKIFTTPRKLIHSLQDSSEVSPGFSAKQSRRFASLSTSNTDLSPESVSSTDDLPVGAPNQQIFQETASEYRNETQKSCVKKAHPKTKLQLLCGLSFILLAAFTPLLWINHHEESYYLVPT